jgi:hypothetical protein
LQVDKLKSSLRVVLALVIGLFAGYVARSAYYSHKTWSICLMLIAVAASCDRDTRSRTFVPTVLLVSTFLLFAFDDLMVSGQLAAWRIWQLGGGLAHTWIPLLVLAALAGILGRRLDPRACRPASAVAAAAFIVVPAGMSDVVTGYERPEPTILLCFVVTLSCLVKLPLGRVAIYIHSIVEPVLIVMLGWLLVAAFGLTSYVGDDWRWLALLLAAPVSLAAALTGWRGSLAHLEQGVSPLRGF